jgi:peptidoglycan-N-acetylglucosamine deacetylase
MEHSSENNGETIMQFKHAISILIVTLLLFFGAFAQGKTKQIALTFDDGPSATFTPQILQILQDNNIHATFFVMGLSVKKNPAMLKKVFDAGNVIGNHTYTHPNLAKLGEKAIESELTKNDEVIYKTIHVHPILMRPPYGMSSSTANAVLAKLGYKKITWTYMVDDYDAKKTTSDIIANSIIKHASPGAIMVMHDCCIDRSKTVAALPVIIQALKKQGYEFVTVAELLHIDPYRKEQ